MGACRLGRSRHSAPAALPHTRQAIAFVPHTGDQAAATVAARGGRGGRGGEGGALAGLYTGWSSFNPLLVRKHGLVSARSNPKLCSLTTKVGHGRDGLLRGEFAC